MSKNSSKILELEKKLQFGSKAEIAKRTNYSTKTVSKVLKGGRCSLKVYKDVIDCARAILIEISNI